VGRHTRADRLASGVPKVVENRRLCSKPVPSAALAVALCSRLQRASPGPESVAWSNSATLSSFKDLRQESSRFHAPACARTRDSTVTTTLHEEHVVGSGLRLLERFSGGILVKGEQDHSVADEPLRTLRPRERTRARGRADKTT
jgi:hypothetical protein